ncbi:MAG: ribose-phosphate diphosphokinase [Gammaproteobacteria bacterium]|nr:ribose-phosphate diphosphokinase [Gammaproteobacteria bacterium]
MILSFEDYAPQSQRLAAALNMPCHIINIHRFPDGENKITLPQKISDHAIFCRSLNQPNEKLLELLLAAKTARELGAKQLTLVAPYLCYMRQDKAFCPGEAVSQTIVGKFLAELFDNVITVDPHLHRIERLQQAVPARNAVTLSATGLMSDFLHNHVDNPLIIGPDSESEQWIRLVAESAKWDYAYCNKTRHGDREIEIAIAEIEFDSRNVVLIDDISSSGETLAVAAEKCLSENAASVDVLVTHALFSKSSEQRLARAGVRHVWSTDSISHNSNKISLQHLLSEAVIKIL